MEWLDSQTYFNENQIDVLLTKVGLLKSDHLIISSPHTIYGLPICLENNHNINLCNIAIRVVVFTFHVIFVDEPEDVLANL